MKEIIKRLIKNFKFTFLGLIAGLINGTLGVGGGTFLIPSLTHISKTKQHIAHGTTILVILPTAIASTIVYGINQQIDFALTWRVILSGMIGSFIGARLMNKLSAPLLKSLFAIFIIITGIRLILI
ncbi:sulfite exporter TauE/SafE family protein [Natranaerofaba carboxydovora]|uniref:sulfite exporter TauE/SafE family protein n=1 Tax=Natranaerofaba carboxydovora TaxID=2742683 RepID=UPI001F12CAE2|nr:sulfite exporter TauE/SafE family protein [Natranaerofaba carboxydovora]UMZ75135.1 Sulfite exporter TauE/SafE [Natranaerofaba carboxydovora]